MSKPVNPAQIQSLLVRGTNWVGDAVMSIPALRRIRQVFPRAKISLLVLPWVSGVYEDAGFLDEVLIYDRDGQHAGLRGKWQLIREMRLRKFDAAILLQNAFEAALLAFLAGIPLRAGYDREARGWLLTNPVRIDPKIKNLHQTYYYLDLIDQLMRQERMALSRGLSCSAPEIPPSMMPDISLEVSPERRKKARSRLATEGINPASRLVGVNPGAFFGSAKRWPEERFARLLDGLIQQTGAQVVLFGSPREITMAESIQSSMKEPLSIFSGRTTLSELIAMMSCCDLFITNDSGPMHLAAALRIPTLAIFGSTDDIATGPLSPHAVVVNKRVECSPCLLRECPIDLRCMTRISVEEVLDLSRRMLDRVGNWNEG
jgi:heptosyltransferase-2